MVDKLNRIKVEQKLKSANISIFTPAEFSGIFKVSAKTASMFISRNLKSGLFVKLRNNYYSLNDSNLSPYLVANRLYQPSYISLEKALYYYGIIPEVVYTITSVTTKATREFDSDLGAFSYQKIKQSAYTGYEMMEVEGQSVLFAEPEKALADYLYFVDLKQVSLNDRLNLKKTNKKKLLGFARLFGRPSLFVLINKVYANQTKAGTIY